MAYSARLRKAVGAVRATLSAVELCDVQAPEFAQHGDHAVAADAPLVLVACSGGRDSMALAAVSHIVCTSMGVRCGAVIVDHGLQAGSEQVASEAADRCHALGLGLVIMRNATVQARGEGLEAAARQARYDELCAAAHESGAIAVLLAHTMDDQAETVLIGLLRSRGVDALAGMPQVFTRSGATFARPLLTLTRAETTGICEDLGVEYWDDPTNGDAVDGELPNDYPLRSRVRHDLLPAIERFAGFNVTRHFAESARLARMDKEYLDQRSDEVMGEAVAAVDWPASSAAVSTDAPRACVAGDTNDSSHGIGLMISVKRIAREPEAIRLRVIAHALSQAGVNASAAQIAAIDRLVVDWHGQGGVSLPRGYSANRKKHVIRVCQDGAHANR
ncbi:tRNA lysidine(34) synthetase TilS [Bifidobacterium longum subsp. longum]|jgi:tRNA(Ile)-lysidine synthase|uniref:tRNA(Ile)-lysidine synthase n=1 Tax=Bifidobacterium longum TaxID=216816 RepID=A0A2N0SZU7_BIFLN|nr:tRNA lysidine(34) synthetase TilS [Bifidobacterium longum]MBL3907764.1 tRNA lysidine(34) synthetase TilS [Bifidobacterium longum subsp. longum]MCB6559263.1 tRNA lysidine(34) synthetase TilS [Bifidobacterium longum]MDB6576130.1 tRNA lysidine(34) synthetase TilS [Bifidobacterium longum]MDB6580492.1 tRNA lysidine(34) synthetase TilS [Bifidobacterium longum]MDB6582365.1 tRNA lysidine(34) synthetase TilS [Bifidobacterium longum]